MHASQRTFWRRATLTIALVVATASLEAQPASPADMFGFEPGDDYELASYQQMESYYRQLAEQSARVQLREIGRSALGRTLYLLTISSKENLDRLDHYRSISEQLARARVDNESAVTLASDGKTVVWIDGGLHATELAHGQMTPLLAHRVATEESAEMAQIRENVIFLLMPLMNPDGLEIVRKWYDSQVGTPYETTNPPELYHHYVGHDNNRDFFMNNMPESKAVAKVLYNEWYPQIVYNQHQISPPYARIVIPPYSDPLNPAVHPGVTTGLNEVGSAMGNRFALKKMPGAISDVGFSITRYYIIPADQRHADEARNLVNILLEGGIEIDRATTAFRVGDKRYSADSFIVPAAQAFRPYIVDLLEKQEYPDTQLDPSGETKPPYDIAGWTLPMQMGVSVDFISDDVDVSAERIPGPVSAPAGEVNGNARFGYALSHATNASVKAVNRLLRNGETVFWSNESFRSGRSNYDVGTFIIEANGEQTAASVSSLAADLGLDFAGLSSRPSVDMSELKLPRVGLYKSYVASMDEGWTRWVLEDYGYDLVSLSDQDIRDSDLSGMHAIIIPHPDARLSFADDVAKILTGHPVGSMPEQYVGGLGLQGALALQNFARDGGSILTFGSGADFAIGQFGLPVRNIVAGASQEAFLVPGSLIRATVDASKPLAYGMDSDIAVSFVRSAAFDVRGQAGCVNDLLNQRHCTEITRGGRPLEPHTLPAQFDSVVNYASEDLLLSGWARGTEHISNKAAMVEVPLGDGEVIPFGFRPQFRGQPRGTYKLIFNALHAATIRGQ